MTNSGLIRGSRRLHAMRWRAQWLCGLLLITSGAMGGEVVVTVTGPDGKALSNAVLSLHQSSLSLGKTDLEAVMDQVNKQFVPHVLPVQSGTFVSFPNSDNILHHVYSFSDANTFELRLYHGFEANPVRFAQPGIVVLGCNIHDSMLGYIYVVDTPYFVKSGVNGKLQIRDLPAGHYELRLWHPRMAIDTPWLSQPVTVPAVGTLELGLQVQALKPDPRTTEPKSELEALFALPPPAPGNDS